MSLMEIYIYAKEIKNDGTPKKWDGNSQIGMYLIAK